MEQFIAHVRESIKNRKIDEFKKNISKVLDDGHIIDLIADLTDYEIRWANDYCEKDTFFLHKIVEKVKDTKHLNFLKSYKLPGNLDSQKRTLLHTAVINDRNINVLKYLKNEIRISIESKDEDDYTPLHYYCQKDIDYDSEILTLLMKDQFHLTMQSRDDLSPLEYASSNPENISKIQNLKDVDFKKLLRKIDKISLGAMDVKHCILNKSMSAKSLWFYLLKKNDKYMVLSYIKRDDSFDQKYYLDPQDIISIILKCPENGHGLISYVRERIIRHKRKDGLDEIFTELTGITIKGEVRRRMFHKSALFLALVTGRFELISPLLRSCQFNIVPFALLICLICQNMIRNDKFPDQVLKCVYEVKDFCENYAIAVMNRSINKDLSTDNNVTAGYISKKAEKLYNKSILEVAYFSSSYRFLCLPSCQDSLTKIWKRRGLKCPEITFYLHCLTHLLFLCLYSFVVLYDLFSTVSVAEWICYSYGLGYLVQELRQIYVIKHRNLFRAYVIDSANSVDICALISMIIGFILRVSLRDPVSTEIGDIKFLIERKNFNLFVQRLFLCLALIGFFMRVLYFASLNRTIGPKLKMISTMILRDLMPLIFIFLIFMISFGVSFQCLLYPNSFYTDVNNHSTSLRKDALALIAHIFRRATFSIFDFQYALNEIENQQNIYVLDANGRYAVYILLIIFIVVVNVMLMNLLIALFSNTVTLISQESNQWWKGNRYAFINEYLERTIAPPPLNIIMLPFYLINARCKKYQKSKKPRQEEENIALTMQSQENPEDYLIPYYICQAFAMNGERFRLVKDPQDLEYEKEIHFKNIENKLELMERESKDLKEKLNKRLIGI